MLWLKAWQDTRLRFLVGLALLMLLAAGIVYDYMVSKPFLDQAREMQVHGPLREMMRESILIQRDYRGFVWFQWFSQNLSQIGTLFAALLGTGTLLSRSSSGLLFSLSLPVPRQRLLGTRATLGLAEWLVLATVPSLLIPMLSSTIGETYALPDALVHGAFVFVAGSVFFSLAILLSAWFEDFMRPLLLTIAIAVLLAILEHALDAPRYGVFYLMRGQEFFKEGTVPWEALFGAALLSAVMLCGAGAKLARRDY